MPDHVPLPALAHFAPNIAIPSPHPQQQQQQQQQESAAADALSVVLVMRSYDGTVRYWDAWSGICTVTIQTQHHQLNRIILSPDKRFLAATGTDKLFNNAASAAASRGSIAPLVTLSRHVANAGSAPEWNRS